MSAIEELLFAAERLAEELEDLSPSHPLPDRCDFDEDERGNQDFDEAVRLYLDELQIRDAILNRTLRDFRRAQQRELSERILRSGKAAV